MTTGTRRAKQAHVATTLASVINATTMSGWSSCTRSRSRRTRRKFLPSLELIVRCEPPARLETMHYDGVVQWVKRCRVELFECHQSDPMTSRRPEVAQKARDALGATSLDIGNYKGNVHFLRGHQTEIKILILDQPRQHRRSTSLRSSASSRAPADTSASDKFIALVGANDRQVLLIKPSQEVFFVLSPRREGWKLISLLALETRPSAPCGSPETSQRVVLEPQ